MHRSDIATLFALGAALFVAIGDVLQQRSAHDVTDEPVGHVALFLKLLKDKQWWLGSLVAGFFVKSLGAPAVIGVFSLGVVALALAVLAGSPRLRSL